MGRKIRVESNLRIANVFEPPFEIEFQGHENTLQDVLERLSTQFPHLRFMERGGMGDDLRDLLLNGESHLTFDEGLRREINEGDTVVVEAYMDPLAGG